MIIGRSKKKLRYHGREGYPLIHKDETSKRFFIMVRVKGGGTGRIYLDKDGNVPKALREAPKD